MDLDSGDVVITGLGPVTSIGVGHEALWASLARGRSNVQRRALHVDVAQVAELPLASMPQDSDVPGLDIHMRFLAGQECEGYRDVGYAMLAIELALTDAGLEYDRDKNRIGVIQAFEAPGVERTVRRLFELMATPMPTDGPPQLYGLLAPYFYNTQAFVYVHVIGKAFGLRGFSTGVHNACSSGSFAIEVAARRIRSGQADAMLVVGGEAFDTAVRLEWFRRLNLYAINDRMCPFDPESLGFYVGEGAGAIVLESAQHAERRGASIYARYLGGAFAHQGWKQVIPDVRSARLRDVITTAMADTNVSANELDLIVPHGAGTLLSDGYEASCLAQALGEGGGSGATAVSAVHRRTAHRAVAPEPDESDRAARLVATAFKPYVGHMLAASGIIETICTLLAIKHQSVPATLNTRPECVQFPVPLATTHLERPVNTALKLSTGFTGHDAALLFRAV